MSSHRPLKQIAYYNLGLGEHIVDVRHASCTRYWRTVGPKRIDDLLTVTLEQRDPAARVAHVGGLLMERREICRVDLPGSGNGASDCTSAELTGGTSN